MSEVINNKQMAESNTDDSVNNTNTEDEIREAFKIFDRDNNGLMSVIEFRHIMTNLGEALTPEEIDEVIREVNVDDDGNIRYEDFIKLFMTE